MGDKFRTMLNLEIIKSDLENDLFIFQRINSWFKKFYILLRESIKDIKRKTILEKYEEKDKKNGVSER